MSAPQSIYIDAPVETVFDFCADPRASWSTGPGSVSTELVDVIPTKEGVGTYYTWAMNVAGLRITGFDVYTEYVPNERFTDRSSAAFAGTWTYTFTREGSGTRLTMQRHPASFWALRPVDRLVDRLLVSRLSRQALDNVKAELEKPTASAAEPAAEPAAAGGGAH